MPLPVTGTDGIDVSVGTGVLTTPLTSVSPRPGTPIVGTLMGSPDTVGTVMGGREGSAGTRTEGMFTGIWLATQPSRKTAAAIQPRAAVLWVFINEPYFRGINVGGEGAF